MRPYIHLAKIVTFLFGSYVSTVLTHSISSQSIHDKDQIFFILSPLLPLLTQLQLTERDSHPHHCLPPLPVVFPITICILPIYSTHFETRNYFRSVLMLSIFPGGSDSKVSAYNAGDLGSIPGSGRSPGEGNGNPHQYSCLENPMDGGTWLGYSPWGCKESDTTERLHSLTHSLTHSSLKLQQYQERGKRQEY